MTIIIKKLHIPIKLNIYTNYRLNINVYRSQYIVCHEHKKDYQRMYTRAFLKRNIKPQMFPFIVRNDNI